MRLTVEPAGFLPYIFEMLKLKKKKNVLLFQWASLMAQMLKNPPVMQETWD